MQYIGLFFIAILTAVFLIWCIHNRTVTPERFGARGDGVFYGDDTKRIFGDGMHDDTEAIKRAITEGRDIK